MFLCYNSIDEGGDRVPVTILLIAVSLAMDAFAVSVSCGISVPGFGVRQAARVGLWFGLFQFLMPLAGWALGTGVSGCIRAVARASISFSTPVGTRAPFWLSTSRMSCISLLTL